jgi:hypothetical protein
MMFASQLASRRLLARFGSGVRHIVSILSPLSSPLPIISQRLEEIFLGICSLQLRTRPLASYSIAVEQIPSQGSFLSIAAKVADVRVPKLSPFGEGGHRAVRAAEHSLESAMDSMLRNILLGGLVYLGWYLSATSAQAQVIWGGEPERYFRPGAYTPFDGQNFQTQYGYDTASPFLMFGAGNITGSQLRYLDYADRLERAYKFGYPLPASPYQYTPPTGTTSSRFGLGLGFFRR